MFVLYDQCDLVQIRRKTKLKFQFLQICVLFFNLLLVNKIPNIVFDYNILCVSTERNYVNEKNCVNVLNSVKRLYKHVT